MVDNGQMPLLQRRLAENEIAISGLQSERKLASASMQFGSMPAGGNGWHAPKPSLGLGALGLGNTENRRSAAQNVPYLRENVPLSTRNVPLSTRNVPHIRAHMFDKMATRLVTSSSPTTQVEVS